MLICSSSFKSTPLSPCYTHVKSRCVLLILTPPPCALLHTCQVSMCTSSFKSTPLSPCYTHVKSRCVLLILNPPPFRLATHMSNLGVYFLIWIHPPFALLHTCQVLICTSSFKSTPLSPCYTHVKSRCVLLILTPPPCALLHTCQVSMCISSFKSTPLSPCYTHVKSRCVLLILNPPPFRLATHMSSLDVCFLF